MPVSSQAEEAVEYASADNRRSYSTLPNRTK